MKRYSLILFFLFLGVIAINACQTAQEKEYETRWMGEQMEEILNNIEDQFGGFDQTMMETGYRYNELYWAGQEENWGYAEYHIDKIISSMQRGFVRRPDREASSKQFVDQAYPALRQTIENEDKEAFNAAFVNFASSCNTCHAMEDVAFMQIIIPEKRTTLVKF